MIADIGLRPQREPSTGRFLPGNTAARQPSVSEILDKATTRQEAIQWLIEIARAPNHRDRYRAVERIVSYYFGTPRINMDVTTNSEPALLMRQLWMAMAGETNVLDSDVNVIDAAGGPAAAPTEAAELLAVDTSQDS